MWFYSLLVLVFGAAIGSFLNVVIYRLPAGLSLLYPPSQCPHCHHSLQPWDNVPILGWFWLGGRCRYCRLAIAFRYPLVETLTSLLFGLTFWSFGISWLTLSYWLLVSWLLVLAFIDMDTLTLPNVLTQSGLLIGLAFQVSQGPSQTSISVMGGIGGMVLGIWLFDSIRWLGTLAVGQSAMGLGDAKLAAMLGAWLGWQDLLLSSFLACLLGTLTGLGAIALGHLHRRQPLPFGPFLALGAILTLFWGEVLKTAYVEWFFP